MSLDKQKKDMRALARAKRQGAFKSVGSIGAALVNGFASWAAAGLAKDMVVGGYHPIRDEADILPLMKWLAEGGFETCLPVTSGREKPLVFRQWSAGESLVHGGFDVMEPTDCAPALEPDLMLIPLLAFDLKGGRLGYGAGHYDRTIAGLANHRPVKMGVAYSAQEIDEVPMGPTDQRLDAILTETGLRWFNGAGQGTAIA